MAGLRLLDLYCGAGGASYGYYLAGFTEIVGVDIRRQKSYPFTLVKQDALQYLLKFGAQFDFIHASPPCQAHSIASVPHKARGKVYKDWIADTRAILQLLGKPWVMENVVGAPLVEPLLLCGTMFGLKTYRHRLFETSFPVVAPPHPEHVAKITKMGRMVNEDGFITMVGHFSNVDYGRKVMGCPWMSSRELAQAIPPAYTRYIGQKFLEISRKV